MNWNEWADRHWLRERDIRIDGASSPVPGVVKSNE